MTKVVGSGISWQKVTGEDKRNSVDLFKQRKAFCRHARPSTSQDKLRKLSSAKYDKTARRPSSAIDLHDPECSRHLRGLPVNAKSWQHELNDLGFLKDTFIQRNCISAADNIQKTNIITYKCKKTSNSKSEFDKLKDLVSNEKMKTLESMISPHNLGRYCRDLPNEREKSTRNFSESVEDCGTHIKFKVTASGTSKSLDIRSRPLNEFQLTYEEDKVRAKDKTRRETDQTLHLDKLQEASSSQVVINHIGAAENGPANGSDRLSLERPLTELQLAHEQDRIKHEQAKVKHFNNLDYVKTIAGKKGAKRIIKRQINNTDRNDDLPFGALSSPHRGSESHYPMHNMEDLYLGSSYPNGECEETTLFVGNPKQVVYKSDIRIARKAKSIQTENVLHPSTTSKQNWNCAVSDSRQPSLQSLSSQSQAAALTSVRVHSHVGLSPSIVSQPSGIGHEQESSFHFIFVEDKTRAEDKTGPDKCQFHLSVVSDKLVSVSSELNVVSDKLVSVSSELNVVGEDLISVSSELSSRPQSESESGALQLTETTTIRQGPKGDLPMHYCSQVRQHGNTSPGVQADFIDANNLNISWSVSDQNVLEGKNRPMRNQNNTSKFLAVEPAQLAQVGSPVSVRQTNVQISYSPGLASSTHTQNISVNSKSMNNSIQVDSPRQTNISTETEMALAAHFPNTRQNRSNRTRGASISQHKDTCGYCYPGDKLRVFSGVGDDGCDVQGVNNGCDVQGVNNGCDVQGVNNQSKKMVARNGNNVAPFHHHYVASESSGSDSIDSIHHRPKDCNNLQGKRLCNNTDHSLSGHFLSLKLKNLLNSQGQGDSVSEKPELKMGNSQAIPATSVHIHSPQLKSFGKTKVYNTERISHEHKTGKGLPSTLNMEQSSLIKEQSSLIKKQSTPNKEQIIDVKQKRILIKKPQKNMSKGITKSCTRENDKLKIGRSKSATEVSFRGKHTFHTPGSNLQERKRPESSIGTTGPASKILTCFRSRPKQINAKGTHSSTDNTPTVPLDMKVHQLLKEVEERLNSKENAAHGYDSHNYKNTGSSSKIVKSQVELGDKSDDDENIIYNRLKNETAKLSSAFVTSTPIKNMQRGRITDENYGPNVKQSRNVNMNVKCNLVSAIYENGNHNKSQIVGADQMSDEHFRARTMPAGDKLDSASTSLLSGEVDKSHNDLNTVPLMTVTTHQKTELDQDQTFNHQRHLSLNNNLNMTTESSSSCLQSQTQPSTLPATPPSVGLMSKPASNQGRSGRAEMLLNQGRNGPSEVLLNQGRNGPSEVLLNQGRSGPAEVLLNQGRSGPAEVLLNQDRSGPAEVLLNQGRNGPSKVLLNQGRSRPAEVVLNQGRSGPAEVLLNQGRSGPAEVLLNQGRSGPAEVLLNQGRSGPAEVLLNQGRSGPAEVLLNQGRSGPAEVLLNQGRSGPAEVLLNQGRSGPAEVLLNKERSGPAEVLLNQGRSGPAEVLLNQGRSGPAEVLLNQGRSGPAEVLLNHLDNPRIVQLLQKLYKADHETRQIIMTQVEFFQAWQEYVVSSRDHRTSKGILTQKSVKSCSHRLLRSHFSKWQLRVSNSRNMRHANALYRCHVLTKGFNALRWSVNQSQHLVMKLQTTVHAIRLRFSFQKWKSKVEKQRKESLEDAVQRWRQYVCETQKTRYMTQAMEHRIVLDVLHHWKRCYDKRAKRHTAFSYLRKMVLRRTFTLWQFHFSERKEKKEMYLSAVLHHQNVLLKSSLRTMAVSLGKAQEAGTHFRRRQVCKVFLAWRKAVAVCQTETQEEMAVSVDHWQKQTLRQSFINWREQFRFNRVARKADFRICRKLFSLWRQAWETKMARYQAVEAAATRDKLHNILLAWREAVVEAQRRQNAAVALIENCYLKHVLLAWKMHVSTKATLRRKTQLHRVVIQHKTLKSCLSRWQQSHRHHQEKKLARQLWSEGCAKKMVRQWKLVCYRASLERLFVVTQPEREQRLIRVMFVHWVACLSRRTKEMEQADELFKAVQRQHLLLAFKLWLTETQRALRIEPLIHRRERDCLKDCFVEWRDFVLRKSKCRQSQRTSLKKILGRSFHSWRKQHWACLVEKRVKVQMSQSLLRLSFREWWFLIHCKRKSHHFNILRRQRQTFQFWRERAEDVCTQRAAIRREEETSQNLRRKYFTMWLEMSRTQVSWTNQCVDQLMQKQHKHVVMWAFISWRRHMQSTLISCAYQKGRNQRLMITVFSAWQELTHLSVSEAILRFSDQIGLAISSGQESESSTTLDSFRTSCPSSSSFHSLDCEAGQDKEVDGGRVVLFAGGLQDLVVDQRAKRRRLKETIETVVHRLMHWPVCAAFEQWKEFAARKADIKAGFNQLQALQLAALMSRVFRDWRSKFLAARTAQDFRNTHLMSTSLKGLCLYRDHRKYVKQQSVLARQHRMLVVLNKFFPPWLHKTQVRLNHKRILHLWTGCTAREIELQPLESYLTHKLGQRSLLSCFSAWLGRYQAVTKLRSVYRGHLLRWVLSSWQEWAREKHGHRIKSLDLLCRRRTQMTFRLWTCKLYQLKVTEKRYQDAWRGYLLLIVQRWRSWAKSIHDLNLLQRFIQEQRSQQSLMFYFCKWKSSALKIKEFRVGHNQRNTYNVLCGWRTAVRNIRNDKQKVLQCQMHSNGLLARQLLIKWHSRYTERKIQQRNKRLYAEQCAVSAGIKWKKKAQKTRGQELEVIFLRRKVLSYLQHWKTSLANLKCLYTKLDSWNQSRKISSLSNHFRFWKTQLLADQARLAHTARFLLTVMTEWRYFVQESKHRRTQCIILQQTLQDRSLVARFQYWLVVTRIKQSVQQNMETRLQLRTLHSWQLYTKKMVTLRELQAQFTHCVAVHNLSNTFRIIKERAGYCATLQERAEAVVADKRRELVRDSFTLWADKLKAITAIQFYKHLLAVRWARRWRAFITKRRLAQQKEKESWKIAVDYHHHRICKRALTALQLEVRVSELVTRRRQNVCLKFARKWKLRVDMQTTATTLAGDWVKRSKWNKWRTEVIKVRTTNQTMKLLQAQLLQEVFSGWRGLCKGMNSEVTLQPVFDRKAVDQLSTLPSGGSLILSPTHAATTLGLGFRGGRIV